MLIEEVTAWRHARNKVHATVAWHFINSDAHQASGAGGSGVVLPQEP